LFTAIHSNTFFIRKKSPNSVQSLLVSQLEVIEQLFGDFNQVLSSVISKINRGETYCYGRCNTRLSVSSNEEGQTETQLSSDGFQEIPRHTSVVSKSSPAKYHPSERPAGEHIVDQTTLRTLL